MLSAETEVTSGSGDPDSDVPPELFNDLEGKLDTEFTSARANVAPNPDDMEPAEARDDFQIEQQPEVPSARLDQDALDILHQEAEYFSGEKPPAASVESAETLETAPADPIIEEAEDLPGEITDSPDEIITPATKQPDQPAQKDDLDEIRRRISDLEVGEDLVDISDVVPEPKVEDQQADGLDDLIAAEFDNSALAGKQDEQDVVKTQIDDNDTPVQHPEDNAVDKAEQSVPAADDDDLATGDLYEENIPVEEHQKDVSDAPAKDNSIEEAIETLVAEQVSAVANESRPRRKVSARRFPNIDDSSEELYGEPQNPSEALKSMLPDVDELSSEIAHDAEHGTLTHVPEAERNAKRGFMKGFKYAILLYIFIGILYFLQPFILEYVPQAEGFLNLITKLVDATSDFIALMFDKIKGMIG